MKASFSFGTILLAFFLLSVQASFTSCEKETVTVTVIERDTTIIRDTVAAIELTNTQLLTNNAWMVDEVYVDNAGITKHYKRGGENTTGVNYSNIRLTFAANGTGSTTDVTASNFNLTWMFTTADQKNMKLTVNGNVIYNWALVKISENELLQTTPIGNDLVSARYVPVP